MFDNVDDEGLLKAIEMERLPSIQRDQNGNIVAFPEVDEAKLHQLIDEAICRDLYPKETVSGNANTVFEMVRGYGARWFEWRGSLQCPYCEVDLRDHEHGPPFKREVGIYSQSQDRTVGFQCPDCQKTW